jgi:transposase
VQSVRKWLKQTWAPQKRRRKRDLDRFREFLRARCVEVGFNAVVLTRELGSLGYRGSYSAVVKYIGPWRKQYRPEEGPTVRFETGPGEQSQVDWGTLRLWLGEDRARVHLFTMVLGFSRRIFAKAYLSERLDNLLDGHSCAFAHFGGRTESILYDNPRTIVTSKDEAAGAVRWNATFKDRMDFYGVKVRLCRYYRAQTKGKIESGVKYVKGGASRASRSSTSTCRTGVSTLPIRGHTGPRTRSRRSGSPGPSGSSRWMIVRRRAASRCSSGGCRGTPT